ncbi:MBL fold metallo-hydrolase [Agrobacterium tumefaciens]|uniref:MBL fold metallo-hydrolase n=1 Tax=Agrobacterium tumefaciens TaxID=358 RepID=UPI00287E8F58|nr:MBL fold metallo-hydrolase [Agrobacterium tumefaciens]MDS7596450.1 MBL fold metallo-hydrolase [Agrobacterium tumefaciens]
MTANGDYIALLGTKGGPAIRPGSTMPTSSLLTLGGQAVIIDCGLGVTRGLVDQGLSLKDVALIFITHLHSDHYLELGPLLHTAWTAGLKTPVTVYGPLGLERYIAHFFSSMRDDIDLRIEDEGRPDLRDLVTVRAIQEGLFHDSGSLRVHAMLNEHPPLKHSYALAFEGNGKRVVFSGDTAYLPPLADFVKGADLLIHEAMLREGIEALVARVGNGDDRLLTHLLRSHTTAADAARIARDADVKALALHHLIPSDDPDFHEQHWQDAVSSVWSGRLYVGKDGLVIPV